MRKTYQGILCIIIGSVFLMSLWILSNYFLVGGVQTVIKEGVEFLGFHFYGRWRRPKDKAKKKFKEEIKRRTRRQQPVSIETVIRFLNPVIRGWGNYFKGGTVKKLFGELDGYIRARLRSFKAKRRTWGTILYTLPQSELKKMGLVSLSSMLDDTISCKGKSQTKAVYGKTVRTV